MIVCVIIGSRKRSNTKNITNLEEKDEIQRDDKFLINQIIGNLLNRYKGELRIVSYACDDGVGRLVRDICIQRGVKMAELMWKFHGARKWETEETSRCYLSRTPSLVEIGDLFVMLVDENRVGMAEDLLDRLREMKEERSHPEGDRPYVVIDMIGNSIEEHKKGAIY